MCSATIQTGGHPTRFPERDVCEIVNDTIVQISTGESWLTAIVNLQEKMDNAMKSANNATDRLTLLNEAFECVGQSKKSIERAIEKNDETIVRFLMSNVIDEQWAKDFMYLLRAALWNSRDSFQTFFSREPSRLGLMIDDLARFAVADVWAGTSVLALAFGGRDLKELALRYVAQSPTESLATEHYMFVSFFFLSSTIHLYCERF